MNYRLADAAPTDFAPEITDHLLRQLLYARGVTHVDTFLHPDYESGRHDPFLMPNMEAAVKRILAAIKAKQKIVIYSDYDCDGIPGAVVLHDFFKEIGLETFVNYIPHRHYEGFGLSVEAVEKLKEQEAQLIITIDCGTTDVAATARANQLGIDVIITDHHEAREVLPEAVAIVNPKVGDTYPFDGLCGAGVVFKLVEALIEKGSFEISPGKEKWFLDMVAVATIADMVPLVDENRVFAYYGLHVLRKSRRPGLQHLLRKARVNQAYLTEDDVGFTIGPRINAASRMDTPEDAFAMLSTKIEADAGTYVDRLEKLNNERKGMVAAMSKELKKRMEETTDVPDVIVMGNPSWRPALVGLAANSLVSAYNRPVFLWGRDGNGKIKGSCRSNGKDSVITLMNKASDALLEFGGHHMSGGFGVSDEAIFDLPKLLNDAHASLGEKAHIEEDVVIDAQISLDVIDQAFLNTLKKVSPYGVGNPKPLFMFKDVVPTNVMMFGKTKEHLKLLFDTKNGQFEAIAFFSTPESYDFQVKPDVRCTLIGHVEQSYFMGRMQTRVRIVNIQA